MLDSRIGRKQNNKRVRDTLTLQTTKIHCHIQELVQLNRLVEQAWQIKCASPHNNQHVLPGFLHESAWDTWLWGEDPLEEAPVNATMLNRMQLLGLLIARYVLPGNINSVEASKKYLAQLSSAQGFQYAGTGLPSRTGSCTARKRWQTC